MLLPPPAPADEPVAPTLAQAFDTAGGDWKTPRTTKADKPELCVALPKEQPPPKKSAKGKAAPAPAPTKTPPTGDRWLAQEFAALALDFANSLQLDEPSRRSFMAALQAARFSTTPIPATVKKLLQSGAMTSATIERRDACPILSAYLNPLLDPVTYARWLEDMFQTRWFESGPGPLSWASDVVRRREAERDRDLASRWVGTPPQAAVLGPKASEKEKQRAAAQLQKQTSRFEAQERIVRAALESEPSRFGDPSGATAEETRRLGKIAREARGGRLAVVALGDGPAPANLFISEAVEQINAYLVVLDPLFYATTIGTQLRTPLLGVAYAVMAPAVIPTNCLYDAYHGTCTVETIIPAVLRACETIDDFVTRTLPRLVAQRMRGQLFDDAGDARVDRLVNGFAAWGKAIAQATRRATLVLLKTVAEQSGGRVRTPARLTSAGEWKFTIEEKQDDGSKKKVDRTAAEALGYEGSAGPKGVVISNRDSASEIFWMLQDLWGRLGTAVALANQSGVRVFLNAANNRWGGHHPPHVSHRQGTSLDVDAGLVWHAASEKVHNVVKRDDKGRPMSEEEEAGNADAVECLRFMERITGWIVVQAFVLVGITQYIYGDPALVEHASLHASTQVGVERPGRVSGDIDAKGHNNHWHFELLTGPPPGGLDDYVWQVASPTLLDKLHELAVARNADPAFWQKFAGLSAAPTRKEDFDGLDDAADWVEWWERKDKPCGIPLLPIWSPPDAAVTFEAKQCTPRGDFQLFNPGEVPV